MRILLVYPEMPDTFYAMKHFMKVVDKKAAYPLLGLLTMAAMLPAQWEKKLADLNVAPLSDEDIRWADYVFLSAMNVQEESAGVKMVAGRTLFTHENYRFPALYDYALFGLGAWSG